MTTKKKTPKHNKLHMIAGYYYFFGGVADFWMVQLMIFQLCDGAKTIYIQ